MTHDIPAYNFDAFLEQVEKMNDRAIKLGCSPLTLRLIRRFEAEQTSRTGAKYLQPRVEIELLGETPKLEGWSLLASVEMQENGENLVRTVPGCVVPEAYRMTDTHCDHCGAKRRRKEVFVLGHEDGRTVQVGRQCIADFLGHASAASLIARASWMLEVAGVCQNARDEDFSDMGGRGELRRDMSEFLATVAVCVRRLGWVSNKKAQEQSDGYHNVTSTSSLAWTVLTDKKGYLRDLIVEKSLYAEEGDEKLAQAALTWAQSQPTTGVSDYFYNLGVACRQIFVSRKTSGLVASAVAAYQRVQEDAERCKNLEQERIRKHVGEIGKRMTFTNLTIKRIRYFEGAYGVRTLVTFEDVSGNMLVWWASREQSLAEGDVVDVRGTVKVHDEYNGQPQTTLQRATVTKVTSRA